MAKSIYTKRQERLCYLLIECRKHAGLTQQDVADALGRPQSFVAKVEGGERRLDVVEFLELCDILMADPRKLISSVSKVGTQTPKTKRNR